jgi:hypothetical protein
VFWRRPAPRGSRDRRRYLPPKTAVIKAPDFIVPVWD